MCIRVAESIENKLRQLSSIVVVVLKRVVSLIPYFILLVVYLRSLVCSSVGCLFSRMLSFFLLFLAAAAAVCVI